MSETAAPAHPLEDVMTRIGMVSSLYSADLNAMSHEMLDYSSGKARSAYDITSEVIGLHRLAIAGAKGVEPEEAPENDGWHRASAEFKNKETAIAAFEQSVAELLDALRATTPEGLEAIVNSPLGPLPVARLAAIVPMHIMYHSGQLNYIQTLHGDEAIHWN